MHKCNECGKDDFTAIPNLARHVKFVHKMTYEEYIMKYIHDGERPKCKCGCGNEVRWRAKGGFGEYFEKSHSLAHRTKEDYEIVCNECDRRVANTNNILALHIKNAHNMSLEEYLIKYVHNGVRPTCMCGCGEGLYLRKGGFPKFINNHDSQGEFNPMYGKKGKDNPNTGKVRTEAHKKKYRAAGKRNWINHRDKYIEGMSTPEYKKMLRENAINLLAQGKIGPQAPYKTEHKHNPFTSTSEYMHSSWESTFLDMCVELGIPVTKNHGIRIDWVDNSGTTHTYIPDFLGLDNNIVYEIKPDYFIDNDEIVQTKMKSADKWCSDNGYSYEIVSLDNFSTLLSD